jgi:signal transduction histidine kinase
MKIISKDSAQSPGSKSSTAKKSPIKTSSGTSFEKSTSKMSRPTHDRGHRAKKVSLEIDHSSARPFARPSSQPSARPSKENQNRDSSATRQKAPGSAPKKASAGQTPRLSPYERFMSLLRFNITFKLSLGYTLRLFFLLIFLFSAMGIGFGYYLYDRASNNLDIESAYVLDRVYSSNASTLDPLNDYLTQRHLTLLLYDMDETLLYASDETEPDFQAATDTTAFEMNGFPSFGTLRTLGMDTLADGTNVYYVIQKSLSEEQSLIETVFPISLILFLALMLTSSQSASRMAGKHLRPITVMTEQIKDMSLSNRLNVSGTKDELKDLALTFNTMLDDIEQSYDREKQFVSDASHELRTPIAVIKGYAGMLNRWGKDDPSVLEESIQAILSETENMHSLVESLLFIARNDKGTLQMEKSAFNFSELLCEVVKETHLIDTKHNITDHIQPDLWVFGAPDKLKQALRVFIDNSIKYTPDGGDIEIDLVGSTSDLVIKIADNGIGISEEDLPHIFDRFYRADKSRSKMKETPAGGTGLGLSIAKIILDQHDGGVRVESDLNLGTTFSLYLPRYSVD